MFKTIWLGLALSVVSLGATSTPSNATKRVKKTVHSASAHSTKPKPAASKSSAAKAGSATSKSRTAKSTKAKRAVRSYQQAPTPERYKEIQQALIDKGYLHSEATGQWGPDSVDALKRFQADQNITADGKVGALSLIALGLGPKRLSAQTNAAPANPPATSGQIR